MLIPFDKLYEKYNIGKEGILHCGANRSQERQAYKELGIQKVVWVEAIPEIAQSAAELLVPYKNQCIVEACLGSEDGKEVVFNVANNEGQSSSILPLGTHKIAHPEVFYTRSFTTSTTRLDTLIDELRLQVNNNWVLVLDLQGSELDALIGCDKELNKFGAVYLEVNEAHLYEGCALKDEVIAYLNKFGFVPVEEFIYKHWQWGDMLLINSGMIFIT